MWPLRDVAGDRADLAVLRLIWLRDDAPPPNELESEPPNELWLGRSLMAVRRWQVRGRTYPETSGVEPIAHALFTFHTPTFFSGSGRDLPFREPVLLIQGLIRRWNTSAGGELSLHADTVRRLLDAVVLEEYDLRSEERAGAAGRVTPRPIRWADRILLLSDFGKVGTRVGVAGGAVVGLAFGGGCA